MRQLAQNLRKLWKPREDRGQTTVEWVGGLIVVVTIVVACLALVDPVRDSIHDLIDAALSAMRDGPG